MIPIIVKENEKKPVTDKPFFYIEEFDGEKWVLLQPQIFDKQGLKFLRENLKKIENFEEIQEFKEKFRLPDPEPICKYLEKVCIYESSDKENPNPHVFVIFDDLHGEKGNALIPMEYLTSINDIPAKILTKKGLRILGTSFTSKKNFITFLNAEIPKVFGLISEKIGWVDDRNIFVLPLRIIGDANKKVILDKEKVHNSEYLKSSGSIEEWKENIGKYCKGNHSFIFAIGIAFSGILLKDFNVESGGFHFFGGTSSGKSTASYIANSIWGAPEWHESWRTTDNALESICQGHNDSFLMLDEISQAEVKTIANSAYMIANQDGKSRANKFGDSRDKKRWRIIFLSNGEKALEEIIGDDLNAGQLVRIIDIPVTRLEGCLKNEEARESSSVFQNLYEFKNNIKFSEHIYATVRKYYGSPSIGFLEKYTSLSQEENTHWRRRFEEIKEEIEAQLKEDYGTVGKDVLRGVIRFSIVRLALKMAASFGVVSFDEQEIDNSVFSMLNAWLSHREGAANKEGEIILHRLKGWFSQNQHGSFIDYNTTHDEVADHVRNHYGFRKNKTSNQDAYDVIFYMNQQHLQNLCKLLQINFSETRAVLKRNDLLITEANEKSKDGQRDTICASPKYYSLNTELQKKRRFFAIKSDILDD